MLCNCAFLELFQSLFCKAVPFLRSSLILLGLAFKVYEMGPEQWLVSGSLGPRPTALRTVRISSLAGGRGTLPSPVIFIDGSSLASGVSSRVLHKDLCPAEYSRRSSVGLSPALPVPAPSLALVRESLGAFGSSHLSLISPVTALHCLMSQCLETHCFICCVLF